MYTETITMRNTYCFHHKNFVVSSEAQTSKSAHGYYATEQKSLNETFINNLAPPLSLLHQSEEHGSTLPIRRRHCRQ
jgi:hypothetical protein